MKGIVQTRRDFVRATSDGACPGTPDLVTAARLDEGYGGKQVWMRPRARAKPSESGAHAVPISCWIRVA